MNIKVYVVVLIVCHLFVTKSMASSGYGWSENKGNEEQKGADNLGFGVNSTGPYRQYSESGSRRALVDPINPCYTQYFVGHQPPTGFRPLPSPYIQHICQQIHDYSDDTLYATMFDGRTGIAVYVGYRVDHDQVLLIGTFPRVSKWIQDQDINNHNLRQGSNQMYHGNNQNIHKGHLVPAETYSFDCINMVSTFRYTNAVPQYAAFNTGPWARYEDRVRSFATGCRQANANLYLLTGTSEAVIHQATPPTSPALIYFPVNNPNIDPNTAARQNLRYFPVNNPNTWTNIAIPNSMWTAGCCISRENGNVLGGFAAIGNNVQVGSAMHQVTVQQLQQILAIGTGGGAINLFPGNDGCSNILNQYRSEGVGNNAFWTKNRHIH